MGAGSLPGWTSLADCHLNGYVRHFPYPDAQYLYYQIKHYKHQHNKICPGSRVNRGKPCYRVTLSQTGHTA